MRTRLLDSTGSLMMDTYRGGSEASSIYGQHEYNGDEEAYEEPDADLADLITIQGDIQIPALDMSVVKRDTCLYGFPEEGEYAVDGDEYYDDEEDYDDDDNLDEEEEEELHWDDLTAEFPHGDEEESAGRRPVVLQPSRDGSPVV